MPADNEKFTGFEGVTLEPGRPGGDGPEQGVPAPQPDGRRDVHRPADERVRTHASGDHGGQGGLVFSRWEKVKYSADWVFERFPVLNFVQVTVFFA